MSDLKSLVTRILKDDVAPVLYLDAAGIEVLDVADGVVQVRLGSVCGNCPSTIMAVMMGLEQELRRRLPEVEYLELVPCTACVSHAKRRREGVVEVFTTADFCLD